MTRKTFKSLIAAAALAAAAASPAATAYFAVSVPGSAMTMGGPAYPEPVSVAPATAPAAAREATARRGERQQPRQPRPIQASGGGIKLPTIR